MSQSIVRVKSVTQTTSYEIQQKFFSINGLLALVAVVLIYLSSFSLSQAEVQDSIDGFGESGESNASQRAVIQSSNDVIAPALAPNVDLKEVASPPPPITAATQSHNSAIDETEALEDQEAAMAGPTAAAEPTEQVKAERFVLLGAEVAPGTSTRLSWSPDVNIAGLSMPTPVLVINGKSPGRTLCLTSAVHGDELNGIEIVRRVMYDIKPQSLVGKVIGIPIVNLQGFQRGSRYLSDRRDLNRYFPGEANGSLASRIAHSLFSEVIAHCDLLVDMHTGSMRRSNLPQVRADMHNISIAKFTEGFDEMAVVHSPGNPGMLRVAAANYGIPSVTLEVGESLRVQEDQIVAGVNSINSMMEKEGFYKRFFSWGDPEPVYYQSSWVRVSQGGILFNKVKLGDVVKQGQVLGVVTDPITNQQNEILSPASGRVIGQAVNQVVMSGFAAYHVGMMASEEELIEEATPIPIQKYQASVEQKKATIKKEVDPEE